jgi:hypothetical protein
VRVHIRGIACLLGLLGLLAGPLFASPGSAEEAAAQDHHRPATAFDCRRDDFAWSATRPPINLRHVFCGEIEDGRAKGLHATSLSPTWDVARRLERRSDEGGGIYSAIVVFDGGKRKFSTFFPDHCTAEQIVRSIEHAASNPLRAHKQWGEIGLSAPESRNNRNPAGAGHEMFCLDNKGKRFEIRLGVLADGRINTAFPN